jgi:hypothetical protein
MRTKILLLVIICLPLFTKAQITLTAQLPNGGILLKDQLWNMVIINNSNDIAELKLQIDVRDILMGQSVINANSGKIIIGKGMKLITSKDVQPVLYNYIATEFSGNYLPCGSYTVNYHLVQETTKGDVPVADEVVRLNITPLSPPLLTTPADKSSIETVYPQFTWMPPVPMQMFNPLVYDITVVAVEEGQSAKEAVEFNKPVYMNTNLQTPSEKMPSSFGQLQPGKTYAWQVVARSGMAYAMPTEVWMFTIGKDSVAKIIDQAPYIKISRSSTEVTVAHQGVIKMEYFNEVNDRKLSFSVYKMVDKEKKNRQVLQFDLSLGNGQNYLQYDITKKIKLDEKTVYEIAVINNRGEEWMMKFIPVYYHK